MTSTDIEEVLDVLSKDGSTELKSKSVSLADTIYFEFNTLKEIHDPSGTIFNIHDIPDVKVKSSGLLASIFKNIVENSVEHNSNQEDLSIDIAATTKEDEVILSIADNGSGVPDEVRAIVNKGENKEIDDDDIGLGLFIVTRLVDDFGGDIKIEENDPRGTIVKLYLQRP